MKTIVILAALMLTALIAAPVHAAGGSCPTDPNPDLDLAGQAYVRAAPGGGDDVPFVYVETNGLGGLQYGGPSLNGWPGEVGCKDGDLLVY